MALVPVMGPLGGFDQRGGDARIRPAQRDAAGVAGHFQRQAMRGVDDQRQRAGPEFVREREKGVGNVADQRDRLLDRIHQNRQRVRFRAAL